MPCHGHTHRLQAIVKPMDRAKIVVVIERFEGRQLHVQDKVDSEHRIDAYAGAEREVGHEGEEKQHLQPASLCVSVY